MTGSLEAATGVLCFEILLSQQPLTGQGSSHQLPCQPGAHEHAPLRGLQAAPLAHRQVPLQPAPQVPSGQGTEQSAPCQPGEGGGRLAGERPPNDAPLCQPAVPSSCHCGVPTFFAGAGPIHRGAGEGVLAGAVQGAVHPIGLRGAGVGAVSALWSTAGHEGRSCSGGGHRGAQTPFPPL